MGSRYILVTTDTDAVLERLSGESASPRQDFVELARTLNAEIVSFSDVQRSRNQMVRVLNKLLGPAAALAWLGATRKGTFYFTTAEHCGMFLSLFLRFRPRVTHVMIGHRISARKKRRLFKLLRTFDRVHCTICYSQAQVEFANTFLGVPMERLHRIDFQVDERFYTPAPDIQPTPRSLVSVGRELRDYPTLFEAIDGLDVTATVIASSPWSRREDQTKGHSIPANATLRKGLSSEKLRDAYRTAALAVVPLQDVDSPAGITSILEAQAVGRPVVVSASPGILDSIEPDVTVATAPCGDTKGLRETIMRLLNSPDEAAAIGDAGHRAAVEGKTLDHFLDRIADICTKAEAIAHGS